MAHKFLSKVAIFATGVVTGLLVKDLIEISLEKKQFDEDEEVKSSSEEWFLVSCTECYTVL